MISYLLSQEGYGRKRIYEAGRERGKGNEGRGKRNKRAARIVGEEGENVGVGEGFGKGWS